MKTRTIPRRKKKKKKAGPLPREAAAVASSSSSSSLLPPPIFNQSFFFPHTSFFHRLIPSVLASRASIPPFPPSLHPSIPPVTVTPHTVIIQSVPLFSPPPFICLSNTACPLLIPSSPHPFIPSSAPDPSEDALITGGRRAADSAAGADNGVINGEPVGHRIPSCECRGAGEEELFLSVSSPPRAALINNINQSLMSPQLERDSARLHPDNTEPQ
ncbi:unnamed protein product, partial [Pleuronectes platessa]